VCDSEALSLLAANCESFAGFTEVDADVCTWHREVELSPPSGEPDCGRLRWVHSEKVYEDDLDGTAYHEVWERLPDSRGSSWAFRLKADDNSQRLAYLLCAGDYFLFVADRAAGTLVPVPGVDLNRADSRLAGALAAAPSLAAKRLVYSYEASFGRLAPGDDGEPPWRITHSTLPARVGERLLPVDAPREAAALLAEYGSGGLRMGSFGPEGGWKLVAA
jgi:hypothetical protein